jgi:beta-galactosidase
MPKRLQKWKEATVVQNIISLSVNSNEGKRTMDALRLTENPFRINTDLELKANYELPAVEGEVKVTYNINNKGDILVTTQLMNIKDSLPILPRFGNNLIIDTSYDKVTWYGRGEHENYQDRKTAALVGLYDAKVADLYYEYIRPQENGYRTDNRTLSFTNDDGLGIKFTAPELFGFSAHHQLNSDFDEGMQKNQQHTFDIPKRELININIDHSQMGIGGDNSWGLLPHEEYQIQPANLSFSYMISPIR